MLGRGAMNKEQTQQFSELLLKLTNDLAVSTTLDEALERLVEITTTTINALFGHFGIMFVVYLWEI